MTEKRQVYQSNILALPPLKMVLGEVPEPDPDDRRQVLRSLGQSKSENEAREMVAKLIGRLKSDEK